MRTLYDGKRGSHTLTHRAQWENQDLTQTESSDDVTHLQSYPELTGGYATYRDEVADPFTHAISLIIMNTLF